MHQRLPLYQVDAFTSEPFSGNPAAVVLLDSSVTALLDDTVRQKIAAEMNLAETAFVELLPCRDESQPPTMQSAEHFKLRWFTPTVEVPLCGHATLASAAVLFEGMGNTNSTIHFSTLSGILSVSRSPGNSHLLKMVLPLCVPDAEVPETCQVGGQLVQACTGGLPVTEVHYAGGNLRYLLVGLHPSCSQQQLEGICPDFEAMKRAATDKDVRGVIVSLTPDKQNPVIMSRFFAPWCGIPEDPVTGSAHSVLGAHWAQRLGQRRLPARQCSPRGGDLQLDVDLEGGKVEVAGEAVIVLEGSLRLPAGKAAGL